MKLRFKRLLGKKGLTLVEIIVVLLVSSIIIGIAMGMLAPVRRLMNSIKSNAHMDSTCNTVNEYIRGSLQNATSVCIIPYSDLDTVKSQWNDYTTKYNSANGYKVKALGVMENYNGDFRLYDFGDVTVINYSWGFNPADPMVTKSADDGIVPGNAFASLIKNRDGGGRWQKGLDGHEFHKFDVFNEAFYSNGFESGGNYGIQVAFSANSKAIEVEGDDGTPTTIDGVGYLTVYSQIYKRIGDYSWDKEEGGITYFKNIVEVEPANQLKSMSFNLFNGTATLDQSSNVNHIVENDGAKEMVLSPDPKACFTPDPTKHKMTQDGLVILYVVRDFEKLMSPTPAPAP